MIHLFDDDIKIAGENPSSSLKSEDNDAVYRELDSAKKSGSLEKAKQLGKALANKILHPDEDLTLGMDENEIPVQRANLLAFTAAVVFEKRCSNSVISTAARRAFFDEIKAENRAFYDALSDEGVFSFYYLAYRRGGDVVRRIGQTYAMLCGKDGDALYQELGEALYCHFVELIKNEIECLGLSD